MREKAERPAKRKLTRNQRKQIEAVIRQAKGDVKTHTVQDSIPFQNMFPNGLCRLGLLYNILHTDGGQFPFEWDWLPPSGLSTKDFISPSSFHFGERFMEFGVSPIHPTAASHRLTSCAASLPSCDIPPKKHAFSPFSGAILANS